MFALHPSHKSIFTSQLKNVLHPTWCENIASILGFENTSHQAKEKILGLKGNRYLNFISSLYGHKSFSELTASSNAKSLCSPWLCDHGDSLNLTSLLDTVKAISHSRRSEFLYMGKETDLSVFLAKLNLENSLSDEANELVTTGDHDFIDIIIALCFYRSLNDIFKPDTDSELGKHPHAALVSCIVECGAGTGLIQSEEGWWQLYTTQVIGDSEVRAELSPLFKDIHDAEAFFVEHLKSYSLMFLTELSAKEFEHHNNLICSTF